MNLPTSALRRWDPIPFRQNKNELKKGKMYTSIQKKNVWSQKDTKPFVNHQIAIKSRFKTFPSTNQKKIQQKKNHQKKSHQKDNDFTKMEDGWKLDAKKLCKNAYAFCLCLCSTPLFTQRWGYNSLKAGMANALFRVWSPTREYDYLHVQTVQIFFPQPFLTGNLELQGPGMIERMIHPLLHCKPPRHPLRCSAYNNKLNQAQSVVEKWSKQELAEPLWTTPPRT